MVLRWARAIILPFGLSVNVYFIKSDLNSNFSLFIFIIIIITIIFCMFAFSQYISLSRNVFTFMQTVFKLKAATTPKLKDRKKQPNGRWVQERLR